MADDNEPEIRKAVCNGMIQTLATHPSKFMVDIMKYMIKQTEDKDEVVALDPCGFCTAFCEVLIDLVELRSFLPLLILIFCENVVRCTE